MKPEATKEQRVARICLAVTALLLFLGLVGYVHFVVEPREAAAQTAKTVTTSIVTTTANNH